MKNIAEIYSVSDVLDLAVEKNTRFPVENFIGIILAAD